ncbi:MAG: FHA domain-containing protein [Chloroflexota bacterium]
MSNQEESQYIRNVFLLTLNGQVTLHFMDGQTVVGEFAKQDEANIFLMVDGAPLMIPRNQIRYIKGSADQAIERDEASMADQPSASAEDDIYRTQADGPRVRVPVETDDETPETPTSAWDETESVDTQEDTFSASIEAPEDATYILEDIDEPEDATYILEDDGDLEDATFIIEDDTSPPPPSVSTPMAYLECTEGPHLGTRFELESGLSTLGRTTTNNVPLSGDKEISRNHAHITTNDNTFIIEDQNSLNGIFINGERVYGPRQLNDGDELLIGITTLVFRQES